MQRHSILRCAYGLLLSVYLAVITAYVFLIGPPMEGAGLRVHFLDVGQGDAVLIETPDGSRILIDAGPTSTVTDRIDEIIPFWDRRIDYAVITHPDFDHYAGFAAVIRNYRIGEILVNGVSSDALSYRDIMDEAARRGIPLSIVSEDDIFRWPSGVTLDIIWPPPRMSARSRNAQSIVATLQDSSSDFLLTGDIGLEEEEVMIQRGIVSHADVLKVAHHGSSSSTGADFIEAASPRYCIISAGRDNRYGHPDPIVMEKLEASGCLIFSTAEEGTISFVSDEDGARRVTGSFGLYETVRYAILAMLEKRVRAL